MRIVMCGGGTGGHVNPAISIADTIKKRYPDAEISFIGTEKGIEHVLVPKAGYDISFVKVRGFKRSLSLKNIDAAVKAVTSVMRAKKLLKEAKPDLVIGTGGYVSWPTVKAASKLGIPTLIHEQNAFPGMTTKMLSGFADKVCISFEESRKFFDEKIREKLIFTGNPVKQSEITRAEARKRLGLSEDKVYILSFGGSLGAEKVNQYCFDLMGWVEKRKEIFHTHAIGKGGYQKYSAIAAEKGYDKAENIEILEYIYDMPLRMAAADIIVCRAGAITLAELACMGKASILIPSPNVTDDHQFKNASVLANACAAVVMRESEVTGEKLIAQVDSLAYDKSKREIVEANVRRFARPDAVNEIVDTALSLIKK